MIRLLCYRGTLTIISKLCAVIVACTILTNSAIGSADTKTITQGITAGTDGRVLPDPAVPPSDFRLVILPDRTSGRAWGISYLEQAIEDINLIGPDAVFTIGDMVQGYTRSLDRYHTEVDQYQDIVGRLDAPFYPLPGNHDVIPGTRDHSDHRFEDAYKNRFGPLYYSVAFEQLTTISIYTDEELASDPQFSATQIDWITDQIADAKTTGLPLVILMHKPVWRYRRGNWDPIHNALADAAETGMKVIVVAGHFHSMQRDPDIDGVEYHLVGTCGALIDQHPLGGQLQHITMLRISHDGETTLYHHPIGCTLPDDFVLAEDQRRTHRLKTSRDAATLLDTFPQPVGQPFRGNMRIRVENPIDRPITISAKLATDSPQPDVMSTLGFLGRTQIDIFNPYATNIETPFEQVSEVPRITLQPNETKILTIPLRCDAQRSMIAPPQINLIATFTDSYQRSVPVYIRRRIPLKMRYVVRSDTTLDMPLSAWQFSVYDLKEPDPIIGISAADGFLNFAIAVHDNVLCYEPNVPTKTRINNPMSDSFVIQLGKVSHNEDEWSQQYLIEPLGPEGVAYLIDADDQTLAVAVEVTWSIRQQGDAGYGMLIQIPIANAGNPGEEIAFNVVYSDNDESYHTQQRSWSSERVDSVIVLPH